MTFDDVYTGETWTTYRLASMTQEQWDELTDAISDTVEAMCVDWGIDG